MSDKTKSMNVDIKQENMKNILDSIYKKNLRLKALDVIIPESEKENATDPKLKKNDGWNLGKKEIDGLKEERKVILSDLKTLNLYLSLM